MIDWLTFVAPLQHQGGVHGPFFAGEVFSTVPDPTSPAGEIADWSVMKRKGIEGSYSSAIQVQSTVDELGRPALWVSGNPAKWFQGHNIFGSDDLAGLVREMLHRVCASVGIVPAPEDVALWDAGLIKLTRVDVTYSYQFGTLPRVRNALRSLDATAHLKHRGRGHFWGDSLTWGGKTSQRKGSRRSSLTMYAKGAEIEVPKHQLPHELQGTALVSFAQGLLRAEVRMLGMGLKEEHLEYVAYWGDNSAVELHRGFLAGLTIAETTMLDATVIDGLPPRLVGVYQLFLEGHDLRAIYPRRTFYRYRQELMAHGIDIAVKQSKHEPDTSNVIPLRTVLHGYPVSVPEWAAGTPLYFEPRFKVA